MLSASLKVDIDENLGKEKIFIKAGNAILVDIKSEIAIDEITGIHFDISKDEFLANN